VLARHTWLQLAQIAANPATIPNRIPNQTIVLSGSGTNWIQGTTVWTISGVAGCTLVSSAITTVRAASLVISTGGTIGDLAVSDGSNIVVLHVVSAGHRRRFGGSRRWFPGLATR